MDRDPRQRWKRETLPNATVTTRVVLHEDGQRCKPFKVLLIVCVCDGVCVCVCVCVCMCMRVGSWGGSGGGGGKGTKAVSINDNF